MCDVICDVGFFNSLRDAEKIYDTMYIYEEWLQYTGVFIAKKVQSLKRSLK
ncbi:hypothetical protein HOLleu_37891 [Holothuria leucospilota]|uniref:Uncharacterized protein n=1 Tax=Holothuria leucospilota TaxID=206669 RepID=A0A9Q0YK44_HOLLE|nr:hypothetical protein HOLleu_37891 [Holothuria leucospilota]